MLFSKYPELRTLWQTKTDELHDTPTNCRTVRSSGYSATQRLAVGLAGYLAEFCCINVPTAMKQLLVASLLLFSLSALAQPMRYEQIVTHYHQNKNFNGTVLVASGGKIVYQKAVGIAERQLEVPIKADTKFRICSITKTFTAVLILQLQEKGLLSLTDKIGKFLPEYSGEAANKVSIHHLLTYSSGIPNCEQGRGLEVYQTPLPLDRFISTYCSGKLAFEPGTQFSYDNGAYIILGRIIEKITGKTFAELLQERILKPVGMQNSGFLADDSIVKGLIPSYVYNDSTKTFLKDPPYYIQNYHASAAMYATAEDLLKFDQALFQHDLLQPATKALMLTAYPELYYVAYGFWVSDAQFGTVKTKVADRQGAIQGSNVTWLHLIPENQTVIILSNTNSTNLNELREELVKVSLAQY